MKTILNKFTLAQAILMLCASVYAEHIEFGCDEFDDGVLDSAVWVPNQFSEPGHQFTESGGRLNYSSASGVDGWCALDWTDDVLSWNESWYFEVDVHSGADVKNLVFGLNVEDNSSAFSLKYIDSGNGYFYFNMVAFDTNTDESFYDQDFSAPQTNARIRVSFDGDTKAITTSYSTDTATNTIGSISSVGWGWDANTELAPTLFVDNHNDPVASGGLYVDNFEVLVIKDPSADASDAFSDGIFSNADWAENIWGNTPGAGMGESGGELVYTNVHTPPYDGWAAYVWQHDVIRLNRDWTAELDVDLNVESPVKIGAGIELDSETTAFQVELNRSHTNFYSVEIDIFDIPSDSGLYSKRLDLYNLSGSITLRLSYAAEEGKLIASYDEQGDIQIVDIVDLADAGINISGCLKPMIFVDNYGQDIAVDQVTLDNFSLYGVENFNGADDFEDNNLNLSAWSPASPGLGNFSEMNGRLEFSGHTDEAETFWIENLGSYTHDWAVTVDAYNEDNNRIAGMFVSFGSSNSWVNIEHHRSADITNAHVVLNGHSVADDDEADVYVHSVPISNDTVRLGLAFDASSKIIYGAFDSGAGFVLVTNFNISAYGMDACDAFSLGFYAGTESGESVTPGTLYLDSFQAVSSAGYLESDSDGDGLNLLEEQIAGTDPAVGGSVFAATPPMPSPSGHVISWPSQPGRVYTVEWTDSLTNDFQTLETGITHPQNSYTDTVHTAEDGGFYNLKVELEN